MILNTVLEIKDIQQPLQPIQSTPPSIFNLNLAERDQCIYNIENQIRSKINLLLGKRKHLENISKENRFLKGVRNDYDKYNRFIVNEKEEQLKALAILQKYIEDIIVSGKLTDEDIKQSKREQREILKEIKHVKNNLDQLLEKS